MKHLASLTQILHVFIVWIAAGTYQAVLGQPNITLTQTSSVDITSGQVVCPNIHVEFRCMGVNVNFLEWQINGKELQPNFDIGDSAPMEVTSGPYTLYLDTISVNNVERVANMSIRFHANNISNLGSGGRLSCATQFVSEINESTVFEYTIRASPPTPDPLGIDVTLELQDTKEVLLPFNLTWDSNFNSENAITSYTIRVPESTDSKGRSMITCPHSCYPDDSCQCRGLMRGDNVTIRVSAVNCGNQEGMQTKIPVPSSCPENKLLVGDISHSTMSCDTSSSNTGVIANGIVCFNSTTVGSVATYQCDSGYSIVGNSQRRCQSNGIWTDSVPRCARHSSNNLIIIIVVPIAATTLLLLLLLLLLLSLVYYFLCQTRRRPNLVINHNTLNRQEEDPVSDLHRKDTPGRLPNESKVLNDMHQESNHHRGYSDSLDVLDDTRSSGAVQGDLNIIPGSSATQQGANRHPVTII